MATKKLIINLALVVSTAALAIIVFFFINQLF